MRAGRRASTAAIALSLALSLAGCAAPARPAGTVVFASGADLESANPLTTIHPLARQIQRYALFVTLARYDSALQPRPYYAKAWRWSDDRRTLTLTLASGLRWADGAPTTARDAAFTLDAARDPATGYPGAGALATLRAARAADDTTLVLSFSSAQPAFPGALCELPIVPAHLLAGIPRAELRRAPFGTHPVGNGPFRFASRVAGQRWTFERNLDFPASLGGPPRLRRLVIAVVDEATTKFAGLVSGELDVAGVAPTMAPLVRRDSTLRLLVYPVLVSYALVLDTHRPPFDDARVRRAVDLSLDRERLVRAALAGFAIPAGGPVPPASPLALPVAETAPRRDPRRADSLLDAAGWRRASGGWRARAGRPLAIELLTVGSGDNALEQLLQADLARRGIRVAIRQLELGAFLARARERPPRFDALVTGIPGDLALSQLAAMYDSRSAGSALDYGDYHTPRLDSLLAATRAAPDTAALRAAWWAVQRELARELPAVWLYHARGVLGVARRVRGMRVDLRGELATVADWHTSDLDAAGATP